jgi:hypothetical protein
VLIEKNGYFQGKLEARQARRKVMQRLRSSVVPLFQFCVITLIFIYSLEKVTLFYYALPSVVNFFIQFLPCLKPEPGRLRDILPGQDRLIFLASTLLSTSCDKAASGNFPMTPNLSIPRPKQ